MPIIKGFFFDLDDTLVGTKEANFHAYKEALADAGITFSYDDFLRTWGEDSRKFIPRLAPHLSVDEIEAIRTNKAEKYQQHLDKTTPNQSLITFLAAMAPHHTMVLVTTAKRKNAESLLRAYNLTDYFDYLVLGDDVKKGKPDPEAYIKALAISGLVANEVVVFEDSEAGIAAAQAAGLNVVQIRNFA